MTDEPVAMTMFFARTVRSPTLTVSALSKVAWPFSHSTLFFLNRNSMPCVRPFTASSRVPCIAPRSSSTPLVFTPHLASVPCAASSNSSEAWSSAFDGNAADVEAGAAERLAALRTGGLEAQLRGADRGDIAAGPAADHQDVEIVTVSHICLAGCHLDVADT